MNIPAEITSHIEKLADEKAKKHAQAAVRSLSEEIQKSGELNVPSVTGGTVAVNGAFVESLQSAIESASRDRFQKEEVAEFLKDSKELIEERAKDKKK